jgi:hypothetical protein
MTQRIKLVEYGIGDFCKKVQELFEQGYRIDFEDNDSFPVNYGTFIEAGLVKKEVDYNTRDIKVDLNAKEPSLEPKSDDRDVLGKTPIDNPTESIKETFVVTGADVGNLMDVLPELVKPKAGRPRKSVQG